MKIIVALFLIRALVAAAKYNSANSTLFNGRILNGNIAKPDQFPFMVYLYIITEQSNSVIAESFEQICGGSVVSHCHILTAAHCVKGIVKPLRAHVGDIKANSGISFYISSENIIVHEKFNAKHLLNDIALLKTDPLLFSASIKRIELVSPNYFGIKNRYIGKKVILPGWGVTNVDQSKLNSKILQYAEATLTNFKPCPEGFHCFLQNNDAPRSGCGESGGPWFYYDSRGEAIQIGVHSASVPYISRNQPDIMKTLIYFNKVEYHRKWIISNMKRK